MERYKRQLPEQGLDLLIQFIVDTEHFLTSTVSNRRHAVLSICTRALYTSQLYTINTQGSQSSPLLLLGEASPHAH